MMPQQGTPSPLDRSGDDEAEEVERATARWSRPGRRLVECRGRPPGARVPRAGAVAHGLLQERGAMSAGPVLPSQLPKARKVRIAAAYYATYVLLGLMLTCIGPSLDALRAQSASTTEAIAILFTANSLGYIAGSLLAGRLYTRIAGNVVLAVALLILALLTATIPWLGSLALLVVALALIGIPLGVMDVGGNTFILWLFRADVPPYMNALHLSFGVGAFLGPLVFDRFAVATGTAATTFWLFAALMVPVAAWLARLPSPDNPAATAVAASAYVKIQPPKASSPPMCMKKNRAISPTSQA
jgi:MFS family permease